MIGLVFLLLAVMSALAYLGETLVEFFIGVWFDLFPQIKRFSLLLRYVAGAVAVVMAFVFRLDVFYVLGLAMGEYWESLAQPSPAGMILTGAAIGMGSSYLHAFVKKYILKAKDNLAE